MMGVWLALLALVALPGVADENPLVGTVQRVSGNEVQLLTPAQPVTIFTDAKTIVWKTSDPHGELRAGDMVRVQYSRGSMGRLIAIEIQTRTEFSGFVARMLEPRVFQLTTQTGDNSLLVYMSPRTDFGLGGLAVDDGDHVLVVGWDIGNGKMDAIRVATYDTDVPLTPEPRK